MTSLRNRDESQRVVASAFDDVVELFGEFGVYDLSKKTKIEMLRILNGFAANKFNETRRRVENSSLANTPSQWKIDVEYEDDEIDYSMSSEVFECNSH